MNDEPRIDGRQLVTPPVEPGSDALLSEEAKTRIAEAVNDWREDHEHDRAGERRPRQG